MNGVLHMKRIIALAVIIVMAVSVFAGCGSDTAEKSTETKLSDVLSQINKKYPDAVKGLTELKEKSDLTRYYEIDEKDVDDFAAEIIKDNSKASLEIVIVKTNKPEDVKEKLDVRYQAILRQYASYSAEQLKMAKDGGVETEGDYVYLVVAEDSKGIMDIIKKNIG